MGKSRVISTLALMLLLNTNVNVHIVIPIGALLNRDKSQFKHYWTVSNTTERVHYHQSFDFSVRKNDVILVDEADYLIFKNPEAFYRSASQAPTISMTASKPSDMIDSLEDTVLDHLKMQSYAYEPHS